MQILNLRVKVFGVVIHIGFLEIDLELRHKWVSIYEWLVYLALSFRAVHDMVAERAHPLL